MSNFDRMLVLTQEPFVGYMPDDVRGLLKEPMLDVLLASLFACVANFGIWMKGIIGRNILIWCGSKLKRN